MADRCGGVKTLVRQHAIFYAHCNAHNLSLALLHSKITLQNLNCLYNSNCTLNCNLASFRSFFSTSPTALINPENKGIIS